MIEKYYGQDISTGGGSQDPIDKILRERYFKEYSTGMAIEAGANDGIMISTCLHFEENGWKVINFEPSYQNYSRLIINRPNSINHFLALSDKDYEHSIINHYAFDNGGMDGVNTKLTRLTKDKPILETNDVQTIRYDTIIKELIDLFVLDVEGSELDAIKGMSRTEFWPKVFCIEYPHCGKENILNLIGNRSRLDYCDSLNMILVRQ